MARLRRASVHRGIERRALLWLFSPIETHSFTDGLPERQHLELCFYSDILPHLLPTYSTSLPLSLSFSLCVSVAFLRRFGDFEILSSGPVNHSTPGRGIHA